MPRAKPRPSEIALEARRRFIPYIDHRLRKYPPRSYLYRDTRGILTSNESNKERDNKLRIAVVEGDPVDVALDWAEFELRKSRSNRDSSLDDDNDNGDDPELMCIPVVNTANERRPGGDWESSVQLPEENLCRRSNLIRCLTTGSSPQRSTNEYYPLPMLGGIYSPHVVVFRSGPNQDYAVWQDFKCLPVISVAPIRRPKLAYSHNASDGSTTSCYSFKQEQDLMKEKMRTVLRIAAARNHRQLCIGDFGTGFAYRNPATQLATMWRDILFSEEEFRGVFTSIVFAFEGSSSFSCPSLASCISSPPSPSSSSSSPASSTTVEASDYEIFKQEFDPSNIVKTSYR